MSPTFAVFKMFISFHLIGNKSKKTYDSVWSKSNSSANSSNGNVEDLPCKSRVADGKQKSRENSGIMHLERTKDLRYAIEGSRTDQAKVEVDAS